MVVEVAAHVKQDGEVLQSTCQTEILCVVEHHFSSQATAVFQVLLQSAMFVGNAYRRLYACSQDPGMELAWSCLSYLALKNQADPLRAAQIEIITNQILDQSPTLFGVTKHLRPAD